MKAWFSGKWNVVFRLILCVGPAVFTLLMLGSPELAALDNRFYDLRARWRAVAERASEDIVLVAVDDVSLTKLTPRFGPWPWKAAAFTEAVSYCSAARLIGLDILFPEAEWAEAGGREGLSLQAARQGRVVSGMWMLNDGAMDLTSQPRLARFALGPSERLPRLPPSYRSILAPYEGLLQASIGVGHMNLRPEADGVVRGHAAMARHGDRFYPSLPLALVMQRLGLATNDVQLTGRDTLRMGIREIPIDADGQIRMAFIREPPRIYSLAEVMDAMEAFAQGRPTKLPRETFIGRIVLFGVTAAGLPGHHVETPLRGSRPSVLVLANALDNLLNQQFAALPPPWLVGLLTALLALCPALVRADRPQTMYLGGLAILAGYALAVVLALWGWRLMLPVAGPMLGVALSCVLLASVNWYSERDRRRDLEEMELAKQVFTDLLVHDLKGRASTILMSISLLQKRLPGTDPKIQRILHTVRSSTHRLLVETSTLLDIRKMQEGKMPIHPIALSLRDVTLEQMAEQRYAAELCGATFQLTTEEDLHVKADPELLSRMFNNMLWNAVQYAQSGTAIEIGFEKTPDGMAELSVANHGPVVPLREQDLLFRPFTTVARQQRQGHVHSSGLGLTFCKLAVEAHGGRIRMISPWRSSREGVRLVVTLPIA